MEGFLSLGLANAVTAAVLAPVAAVVGRASRRPALAHALWLIVVLKLITPPLVGVPVVPAEAAVPDAVAGPVASAPPSVAEEAEAAVSFSVVGQVDPKAVATLEPIAEPPFRPSWRTIVGATWVSGSAAWLALALWRIARFRRVLMRADPADPSLVEWVGSLSGRLGLGRPPEVRMVPGRVSPMVLALGGRPRLVIPSDLWKRLDGSQREALLVHELAHLKRKDHWVRAVELVATGLFWWNPVLWWARRGLHRAEEECCDLWVVWALPESARTYASALVEAIEFLSAGRPGLPVGASGMGAVADLSRRIGMIMRGTTPKGLSRLGLVGTIGLAALVLPLMPTRAQAPKGEDQPEKTAPIEAPRAEKTAPEKPADEPPMDRLRFLKAQVERAKAVVARNARLKQAGTLSDAEMQAAEAERDKAELDLAEYQLEQKRAESNRRSDLERAEDRLKWSEEMHAKGYVSRAQLVADRLAVAKLRRDAGDGRDLESLRNEAELLEAQARLKEAGLNKARAQRSLATAELARLNRLKSKGPGFVSTIESDKAKAELEIADAGIAEAQGELDIARVKLDQARRWLKQAEDDAKGGSKPVPAPSSTSPKAQNLKRIGLALHNFQSARGHFPGASSNPEIPGGPPVSWRVAILPFLEEDGANELYKSYNFDEPWDAPRNQALIAKMPRAFRLDPGKPGTTRALALVGPGTGLDGPGSKLDEFADGPRNTLLVVEAKTPVEWTRPEDLSAPGPGAVDALGGTDAGFVALFADGTVRLLKKPPDRVFRALASIAGGEVLEEKSYGRDSDPKAEASDQAPGARGGMVGMMQMMAGGAARADDRPDAERRLSEVEEKLERLLREKEQKPPGGGSVNVGLLVRLIDSPGKADEQAVRDLFAIVDRPISDAELKDAVGALKDRKPEERREVLEMLAKRLLGDARKP